MSPLGVNSMTTVFLVGPDPARAASIPMRSTASFTARNVSLFSAKGGDEICTSGNGPCASEGCRKAHPKFQVC